jgi:mannose/fructose/N-acetylgalactosamine-specific phosphotransferase system component IIC
MTPGDVLLPLLLVAWAVLVGMDLTSWPQVMLSRPLVAGAGAGLLTGDPVAGLAVGAVLELFALDVLPIGASRYPDFGVATVGGVVLAAGSAPPRGVGAAVGLGLVLAVASRPMIETVRRANARAAGRAAAELAQGDVATVRRLQRDGLRRDLLRSAVLGLLGIGSGFLLRDYLPPPSLALPLLLVAVAGGVAAALHGVMRAATQGGRLGWVLAGLLIGAVVLWLR